MIGQGEPETTTQGRDGVLVVLFLVAWFGFNELGKAQKGKKSFFDKWLRK